MWSTLNSPPAELREQTRWRCGLRQVSFRTERSLHRHINAMARDQRPAKPLAYGGARISVK
jgi:hypothetical protein